METLGDDSMLEFEGKKSGCFHIYKWNSSFEGKNSGLLLGAEHKML